jgi:lysozyme
MRTSDKGRAVIRAFEGCRLRPYLCPAKLWTVGYGHVLYPEQEHLKLPDRPAFALRPEHARQFTREEVYALLDADLARFERGVARYCPDAVGHQSQFDALVSFAFNLGLGGLQRSSVRLAFNRGELEEAGDALLRYTRGGGKVLPGLVTRRAAERALLLSEAAAVLAAA